MTLFPYSRSFLPSSLVATLAVFGFTIGASAESAAELAAKLDANQRGTSLVRFTMTVKGEEKKTFQLQFKERRTADESDILYQILFPKERLGDSVLASQVRGARPTGNVFTSPDKLEALDTAGLSSGLFGSDLAVQDVVENFYAWKDQSIAGSEKIGGRDCQILVSRPGSGQWSIYGSVKSWIDPTRLVPLKIEKYDDAGRLVRTIQIRRVHRDGNGRYVPRTLIVTRTGSASVTELDGSKIKLGLGFTDETFSVEKMRDPNPR